MHPYIHLRLHDARAADLRRQAARAGRGPRPARRSRPGLRSRLGWHMVELGLRLVNSPVRAEARGRLA